MDRIDVPLAKLVILVSVLLLALSFFASQAFLLVIPLAAGAGGLLYLRYHHERGSDPLSWGGHVSSPTLPPGVAGYLPSVVMVGLAALVLSLHQVGSRTDPIYLLTGGIGVAIFAQILFVDEDRLSTGLVLAQILVAAVVIRLTALYATPGFVGIDIWTHVPIFVDGIAREGSLAPLAGDKYVMAPFYHVIGAVGTLVLGGPRHGVYLTLGLLVPLSALFVYASGRLVFPERWALLATAFFAFSDQFIRWGMHIIPTSLGLVFFLAALYAITRLFSADAERWVVGLLLVTSLAVVFTHQVSTVIVLTLLGIAAAVAVVTTLTGFGTASSSGARTAVALASVFVVTLTTTLVSWSITPFTSGTFLREELAEIRTAFAEDAGFLNLVSEEAGAGTMIGGSGQSGVLAELIPYVELFGFALLLLSAVIGVLYMLHREGEPGLGATHVLTGAILFVLVFGLSLFGMRVLLPGRWIAFLYVSMAILGAGGLYHLSRTGSRRVVLAVFVLVALGYPTTMVVAEKATLDSPAFEDQHSRFAFTEPEIAAVGAISEGDPPVDEQTVATDHPYVSLFRRTGGYGYDASILELGPDGPEGVDGAVYRAYQSTGPVTLYGSESVPEFEPSGTVEANVCPRDWNKGYANDDVTYCTPATLTSEVDG